jgi:hypothetical protein
MIFELLTFIFGILVVVLGYTTINLLIKLEKTEDIISSQKKFLESLFNNIIESEKKLGEIDKKEIFKSDDEIGWIFTEIRKIHQNIFNFINNNLYGEKTK